jgi:hypothetical protein
MQSKRTIMVKLLRPRPKPSLFVVLNSAGGEHRPYAQLLHYRAY